jgi:hypothetical protein
LLGVWRMSKVIELTVGKWVLRAGFAAGDRQNLRDRSSKRAIKLEANAACRAGKMDEKNGYEFTAAMKWREAATLLAPFPYAAERCWQQWERIMCLPRRLAGPIGIAVAVQPTGVYAESSHSVGFGIALAMYGNACQFHSIRFCRSTIHPHPLFGEAPQSCTGK